MFRSDKERRELALTLFHEFKDRLFPSGAPMAPGTVTLAFRDAFMLADFFSQVEAMKKEDLPHLGQPNMPPQQPGRPNGAGPVVQMVPPPKSPDA